MSITAFSALWFLPFVLPICALVIFKDLREMRIPNGCVMAMAVVFLLIGVFVLPFDLYLWRLAQMGIMLVIGILLTFFGAMGAGDSKFIAAAAPFIAIGDWKILGFLLSIILISAALTHRLAKHSPLRKLAPHWQSWRDDKKFPMGFVLGSTLVVYLVMGAIYGA